MLYFRQIFANEISKNFRLGCNDKEGGYGGLKISRAQVYWFLHGNQTTFPDENVKISNLPFTMSQQKCYIFESI